MSHTPKHLREAFQAWIWDRHGKLMDVSLTDAVNPEAPGLTVEALIGRLWNCTATLPGAECEAIDIPRGSTYARAVQDLRRFLERRATA